MKKILLGLPLSLLATSLVACADASNSDDGPSPYDDDSELVSEDAVRNPDKSPLPDDNKADAVYPATFNLVADQTSVKSQGSRGVCSIFATTAQLENLYKRAGQADPDFSEQFLQWSVKNELGTFRNTSGSTGGDNLRSIVRFGTVDEAVWPYESAPWTAANDAACAGEEGLPTKCYTNGEPPAAALAAPRRKVPSSRWINNNSIKAHLTGSKTTAVVGFTFFYQSWNHRRSELPVNSEYWRKGYVTFPNAKDQQVSLTKRAGHAVVIVGWDDNLEVGMRDEAGNPILNPDGTPKTEKGFWLIKNSWGTAGFGIENQFGAGYGWLSMKYISQYGDVVVGELPTIATPVEVCDDAGNTDEDGDGQANCVDADCAANPACAPAPVKSYSAAPAASIPDNAPTGVSSIIDVTDVGTVGSAKLTVDITHTYRGDLKLILSHDGAAPVVVNRSGGSLDDLKATFDVSTMVGKTLTGAWTLQVIDTAARDVGVLNAWKLDITTR